LISAIAASRVSATLHLAKAQTPTLPGDRPALAFPNSADRALENLWREPRVNEYRVGKLAAELELVATFAQLGVTILRFFIAASMSQL
jgi:hypothetical protein